MNKHMKIDGRYIGDDYPPYLVAEISCNHNGNLDDALKLVRLAARAGCSAVKLQTYTPDMMTIDCDREDFMIRSGQWAGKTLYELYQAGQTPLEWHKDLFQAGRDIGITVFSSPFGKEAVDFLEDLNCPAYKIASYEIEDLELIGYAASTGKPLIISTGMATSPDIHEAISCARDNGCLELAILHCISAYPCDSKNANIRTITDMRERFGVITGFSDHTVSNYASVSAVSCGANIIEKHIKFELDKESLDADFSVPWEQMNHLCFQINQAWKTLGIVNYGKRECELQSQQFRRSLYFVNDIPKGQIIKNSDIRLIRPGHGLALRYKDIIIGKIAEDDIKRGTAVSFNLVDMELPL